MEIVPKETQEPEDNSYLSDRAIFANQLARIRPRPKSSQREKTAQAYHDAFDLIGGVPRLALFADENPSEFYPIHARVTSIVEKNVTHSIKVIAPALRPTALDGDITDVEFEEVSGEPSKKD